MILTDTHAHLYAEQFDEDRSEMMERAISKGVERIFLPNIDSESYEGMVNLTAEYPLNCFPLIGLHPCSVQSNYEDVLEKLKPRLEEKRFYGIGEIGLDLYWDKSTLEIQREALRIQINWAKEYDLPIVLHCRDAFKELLDLLEEVNDEKLKGIFHCFTGSENDAKRILDLGNFKLGIGGIVTFKNAGLAEVVGNIALENLVLETDAPYLSPHPFRGKRNESSYLQYIAEKIAEIKGLPVEKVAEVTTNNSRQIFEV